MVSEKIILTSSTTPTAVEIGSRVSYNGIKGTVLFVGEIKSLNGLWYGVEWDDVSRGKHNGSYEGAQYFETRHPTSGSFVRPNKLNFGCTFYEALVDKYQKHNLEELAGNVWGNREVEFVGMEKISEKQSQIQKLRQVVLDDTLISRAGLDDLRPILSNVTELHMCNTLLFNWSEILAVCRQLPNLKYLNLSNNKLQHFRNGFTIPKLSLPSIKTLLLNETNLKWFDVSALAATFPNVVELGLCKNNIQTLSQPLFDHLTSLDLESNPIKNWKEIFKLGRLNKLEVLNLNDTGIDSIEFPSDLCISSTDCCNFFKSLKVIYCCGNKIDTWTAVDELNKLPSLEQLLFQRNPVISHETLETSRQLIIAKIAGLKFLDRLEISTQERRGAELDYLKRYGKQWCQAVASGDNVLLEKFLASHPRYSQLVKLHGAPEQSEMKEAQASILKNRLIELHFVCHNKPLIIKKIPGEMNVSKLKGLVARWFSLDVRSIRLANESAARPRMLIQIDNDFRNIDFYSLENGDKVHVLQA